MKNLLLLKLALFMPLLLGAQNVEVDVNLNIKHSVNGVSDFGRERHITVHSSLVETDWDGEEDKLDYLLNDLDAYFGRDNGSATWKFASTPQDAYTDHYPSMDSMIAFGNWCKSEYELLTDRHPYESKAGEMIMGTNAHPTYPTLSWYDDAFTWTDPAWQPKTIQTSADWVVQYLDKFFAHTSSDEGEPLPKYWEVINEPDMEMMTGAFMVTSLEQIFEYHNLVAEGVKARLGDNAPLIGGGTWGLHDFHLADGISRYECGYLDAYLDEENQAFYGAACATEYTNKSDSWFQWDAQWKGFMDVAGHNMDFYSVHIYDWPTYNSSGGTIRSGGHTEAMLEMIEWYDVHQNGLNNRKPLVISEYGAVQGAWTYLAHDDRYDWECLKPFNSMMMQFLERPDYIIKSMPFTPAKAEWGDTDSAPYHYKMMRDDDGDGAWEWSDYIKWYELWAEVKGTRIDTKSSDPDIQVDCYVDGNVAYLILNNLEDEATTINLNLYENASIQSVNQKHLYLEGTDNVVLDDNAISNPSTVVLAADGTMILKYTFAGSQSINHTSVETKYYGESISGTVPHRITIPSGDVTLNVNGVSVPSGSSEAMLKVTASLYDDDDGYQGFLSVDKFTVNGTEVEAPVDWRGTKQGRSQWFGTLEIPVPTNLLQTNNTFTVDFHHNGEVAVANLVVWDFSTTPGRYDDDDTDPVPVTGVTLTPASLLLSQGGTSSLTAIVSPDDATDKSLSWSSGNTSVATVNTSGVVTAVADGSATITVTTNDGGYTALCNVTVETSDIEVTGVSISPTSLSLNVGATSTLAATVSPSNATDQSVSWSSNNNSIATVSSSGSVTAVSAGTANITATTNDGGYTAVSTITVSDIQTGDEIVIEAEDLTSTGGTYNDGYVPYGVNVVANYGINYVNSGDYAEYTANIAEAGDYQIVYNISTPMDNAQIQVAFDGTTASTDDVANNGEWDSYGPLTAANTVTLSAGSHTMLITATGSNDWQWNLDKITLTKVGDGDIPVTGVSLSSTSFSLDEGETTTLSAIITPDNATNQEVSWSSSNTSVASVNSGTITAQSEGSAIITVTTEDGGYTATCNVTVSAIIVTEQEAYPDGIPHAIPGTIEAVNFDIGDNGVAYYDNSSGNSGSGPRSDTDVDTEYRIDAGNVGWIAADEWLEYTVNVAGAGTYTIEVLVASIYDNGAFHIEFDGTDKTGVQSFGSTGAWGTFATITISGTTLSAGEQVMRVYMDGGNFNLGTLTFIQEPDDEPGEIITIEAEDLTETSGTYDDSYAGGPGYGMNVTATGVNYVNNGDWATYDVTIPQDGAYEIVYYISSPIDGSTIDFTVDGTYYNTTTVTNNGTWDSYYALIASSTANLTAGDHVVTLTAGTTDWTWNLDYFTLQRVSDMKGAEGINSTLTVLDIYPNPASGSLNILITDSTDDEAVIEICNMQGQKIVVESIPSGVAYKMNISHLPAGIYFITAKGCEMRKLIIN